MDKEKPLFILAGNSSYQNRGCEAITRGTVKILRNYFKNPEFLCVSNFQNDDLYKKQKEYEFDEKISHKKTYLIKSVIHPDWFFDRVYRKISPEMAKNRIYRDMIPYLNETQAVLSIGGDNYSLDYGVPRLYTDLDDIVMNKNKPLIIWGASVGPFHQVPKYQDFMMKHFKKVTGIFVRESVSRDYLEKIGITRNIYSVADPAFLLDPVQPDPQKISTAIEDDAIGINFSPLLAKYITNGERGSWIRKCADVISTIIDRYNVPIYLIPHVTDPHDNDFEFLEEVNLQLNHQKSKIVLIPPTYNAGETKWIISKMRFFIGARTHATIAAISSGVPTLSVGYSIKAKGINQDIFGHTEYCLNVKLLTPETISKKLDYMLDSTELIRQEINAALPHTNRNAMNAGKYLKEILE